MERLTKRDEYGFAYIRGTDVIDMEEQYDEAIEKLADYEDAEEQGRMIEFPVAIGDHVWCFPSEAEPYREMQVVGLEVAKYGGEYVHILDSITNIIIYSNVSSLGVSVFKTEEEAEAKLKEMEANNHGDS